MVASEIFDGLDAIIRADLTEGEAKRIVAKIFDVGAYVTSWTDLGQGKSLTTQGFSGGVQDVQHCFNFFLFYKGVYLSSFY